MLKRIAPKIPCTRLLHTSKALLLLMTQTPTPTGLTKVNDLDSCRRSIATMAGTLNFQYNQTMVGVVSVEAYMYKGLAISNSYFLPLTFVLCDIRSQAHARKQHLAIDHISSLQNDDRLHQSSSGSRTRRRRCPSTRTTSAWPCCKNGTSRRPSSPCSSW